MTILAKYELSCASNDYKTKEGSHHLEFQIIITTPELFITSMTVKVAVVQAEPVWYDLQGSVELCKKLIKEAYENGAELVAFSEVFIPGYPVWIWSAPADLDKNISYMKNSLSYDSEEFQSIVDTIKAYPINVVIGLSERDHDSLYIGQCFIDKSGEVLLKRRKMKPTHVERIMWGDAKTSDLISVTKMPFNEGMIEVGALSCWEHMQPLLTQNSAVQHEKIHVGSWPTANGSEEWFTQSKEGFYSLARCYSQQVQAFYLLTCQKISSKLQESIPDINIHPTFQIGDPAAAVFSPDGAKITPDTMDDILYIDLDMDLILKQKHIVDIVGHYSRTDMISLNVNHSNELLMTHSNAVAK